MRLDLASSPAAITLSNQDVKDMLKNIMSNTYRSSWERDEKVFLLVDTWIDEKQGAITTDLEPLAGSLMIAFEAGFQVSFSFYC